MWVWMRYRTSSSFSAGAVHWTHPSISDRKLQPHHQLTALYWLPRSHRLVQCFTAPLSCIWILKSGPSEQRGGLKEMEEIAPVLGVLPSNLLWKCHGSNHVLMMKRDMGTFWNFNGKPWVGVYDCFCCSYLSISKEARPHYWDLCVLNSAKAAIEMLIQHALFILLHLHRNTEAVLFACS